MVSNFLLQANALANKVRKDWGLGINPIKDIFSLLDSKGFFVVRMPIASQTLSGAFFYDKDAPVRKAKILININHTPGRQKFTAAHELCHFYLDKDKKPVIIENDSQSKTVEEKRADVFAAIFLMPKSGINFFIREMLKKKIARLEDIDIVKVKNEFGASWEATINRLNILGYHFDVICSEKKKQVSKLNALAKQMGFETELPSHDDKVVLPSDFYKLAFEAYFKEKISLGRLAEILRQPYESTRELVLEFNDKANDKL